MLNQLSNRTLVTASLLIIASCAVLSVFQPWQMWGVSRHLIVPVRNTSSLGRLADNYQVEIMAPEILPSKVTTTVSFRITNRGQIVTSFGVPLERAVQVVVSLRGSNELQVLTPTFNTSTGSFSAPVSFAKSGIYRFMVDFLPASDTPIRRWGDVDVGAY